VAPSKDLLWPCMKSVRAGGGLNWDLGLAAGLILPRVPGPSARLFGKSTDDVAMTLPSSFSSPQRPGVPPLEVLLLRDGIARVGAPGACGGSATTRACIKCVAGDPQQPSSWRSPLTLPGPDVRGSSGAADQTGKRWIGAWRSPASSHTGTPPRPAKPFQDFLWSGPDLEAERLQWPHSPANQRRQPPGAQLLGKHAAFLATCRPDETGRWSLTLRPTTPCSKQLLKQVA